jgi:hypothetical protein
VKAGDYFMPVTRLRPSDTLSDILDTLKEPSEYVRGVLGNLMTCKKEHGSACVRIGTTGGGISPHYRIEPDGAFSRDDWLEEKFWQAYNGRNHKKLDWGFAELRDQHWSPSSMSFDEVQSLLGKLRKFPS